MEYLPRILDEIIDDNSQFIGGIYLQGPMLCGKTTTMSRKAKTVYRLSTLRDVKNMLATLSINPRGIFNDADCPILFDEWQIVPQLWDEGRNFIDVSNHQGLKILLTGSASLPKEQIKEFIHHSGFGRYKSLLMRPMSLYESKESNGTISLKDLLNPNFRIKENTKSDLSIDDLIYATCRGGWPDAVISRNKKDSLSLAFALVDNIKKHNIEKFIDCSGRSKDPQIIERFLKSYARNDSTQATNLTILKDMRAVSPTMSESTFYRYKDMLDSLFIFEDVNSWSPNMKSRNDMTSLPKKEFVDPSLAIASLDLTPQKLLTKLYDFGFFFENLVIRDLRIYSQKLGGDIYYYRDRNGLEADAVLVLNDGKYVLIEIKLGTAHVPEAIDHLTKIKEQIIKYNSKAEPDKIMDLPSSIIVITGADKAFTTKEGIHIVPIGCLKP